MSRKPDMDGWVLTWRLKLDEPCILLNKWQRMHWRQRSRYEKKLHWLVRAQVKSRPTTTIRKSRIHITRGNPPPRPDHDGLIGGLKPLIDILCSQRARNPLGLGFIIDDSPQYLDTLTADSVITPPKQGFTLIEIWQPGSSDIRKAA